MKKCNWCNIEKDISEFYMVSKKTANYRGKCKNCMRQLKKVQRNPDWRPSCKQCGIVLQRTYTGGRRLCPACLKKTYSINEFRPSGSRRLNLKPCISCHGEKTRFDLGRYCRMCREKWLGEKITTQLGGERLDNAREMWEKYGISERQYLKMKNIFNNRCAICGNLPKTRRLAIEHDHKSKRVRGLACFRCNKLKIGVNTAESAEKVLRYLKSSFDARKL